MNKWITILYVILISSITFAQSTETIQAKKQVVKETPVEIVEFRQTMLDSNDVNVRMGWVVYVSGNEVDNKVLTTFYWYDADEDVISKSVSDTLLVPSNVTRRFFGEEIIDTKDVQRIKWIGVNIFYIKN